jgi:hypothetical protein
VRCWFLTLSCVVACGATELHGHGGTGGSAGDAGNAGVGTSGAGASGVSGDSNEGGGGRGGGVAGVAGVAGAAGSAGAAAGGCEGDDVKVSAWPGKDAVVTLDEAARFTSDLSGLTYDTGVLWAVNNLTGTLFRLKEGANGQFAPDTTNDWSAGKRLRYPGGRGLPDAEGVTLGASLGTDVYVGSERDSEAAATSRPSILRYDAARTGTVLEATHDWDLTALLPELGSNSSIEGITFLPDAFVAGLFDETKGHPYSPSDYPEHGGGLFLVGLEQTGGIYAFLLDHRAGGLASLVASIPAPLAGVMGLELDRSNGNLWFSCDDTCDNESGLLAIEQGRFIVQRRFARPKSLPDSNHEGMAVAPDQECEAGYKRFFWTDDADAGGFSLRSDLIPCGPLTCF